jgi:hypothetical protein
MAKLINCLLNEVDFSHFSSFLAYRKPEEGRCEQKMCHREQKTH